MRFAPALLVMGMVALAACAEPTDVQSTASDATHVGETLPAVDDLAAETTPPDSTSTSSETSTSSDTTVPGTRPADAEPALLHASDLPGWDVSSPMKVPEEPTWKAVDCDDMDVAWAATGRIGMRSRGTNGGASFRNTAVDFDTADEASAVLDAVDRVWTDCPMFEASGGIFWTEPLAMPTSTHATAGIVIGGQDSTGWALAYWQIDASVVMLEVEGDELWTVLNSLLATLSARLDGNPTPMPDTSVPQPNGTTAENDEIEGDPPVLVPESLPPVAPPPTTVASSSEFPPPDDDWAEHPLAHLAPAPDALGPGWIYDYGYTSEAEPADPDDAIEGCDAPVPPTLDGYDLDYRNDQNEEELSIMIGTGAPADSQVWVDAFRAIAGCELDPNLFGGDFELTEQTIAGADDSVLIVGSFSFDLGEDNTYTQAIGAARIDGVLVAGYFGTIEEDRRDETIARVSDVLASMLTGV